MCVNQKSQLHFIYIHVHTQHKKHTHTTTHTQTYTNALTMKLCYIKCVISHKPHKPKQ